MKSLRTLALSVTLVAAVAPAARAQSPFHIDFEALASPVTLTDIQSPQFAIDPRLTDNGMGVFTLSGSPTQGFASWGNDPGDPFGGFDNYTGSTAIFAGAPGTQINVGRLEPGKLFNLTSIDVAPLFAPATIGLTSIPSFQLQIFGRKATGGFFGQTFTIPQSNGTPSYTTLQFNSQFRDLVQVAWFNTGVSCSADRCLHQFDNVVGTTLPEPGTYALLATGLLGVAGMARRRRATTTA